MKRAGNRIRNILCNTGGGVERERHPKGNHVIKKKTGEGRKRSKIEIKKQEILTFKTEGQRAEYRP